MKCMYLQIHFFVNLIYNSYFITFLYNIWIYLYLFKINTSKYVLFNLFITYNYITWNVINVTI